MDTKFKKQLIKSLVHHGARSMKINKKQEMKLREWIIPSLMDEFGLGGSGPIDLVHLRKFIDSWESKELNEEDFKYYYVDKNSNGQSLWDLI